MIRSTPEIKCQMLQKSITIVYSVYKSLSKVTLNKMLGNFKAWALLLVTFSVKQGSSRIHNVYLNDVCLDGAKIEIPEISGVRDQILFTGDGSLEANGLECEFDLQVKKYFFNQEIKFYSMLCTSCCHPSGIHNVTIKRTIRFPI